MGPIAEAERLNVAMVGKMYGSMRVLWERIERKMDGGRVRIWDDWERFEEEWRKKVRINEFGLAIVDFTLAEMETRHQMNYDEAARLMLLKSPKVVLASGFCWDKEILLKVADQLNVSQRQNLEIISGMGIDIDSDMKRLMKFVKK